MRWVVPKLFHDAFTDEVNKVALYIDTTMGLGGEVNFVWTASNGKPYVQIGGGWFDRPKKSKEIEVLVRADKGEIETFYFISDGGSDVHTFNSRDVNRFLNIFANSKLVAIRIQGLKSDILMELDKSGTIFNSNAPVKLQQQLIDFTNWVYNGEKL